MTPLSQEALRSRLRFDFEVLSRLSAPWLQVLGFETYPDLLAGRRAIAPGTPQAAPPYVLARYDFATLSGPGRTRRPTVVAFDVLAGGNYPFTAPSVTVIPPLPWVPRVHPTAGVVCTGGAWGEAGGRQLLAHLLIQVARILNLDEPHSGTDLGFQPDAARYWQSTMGGRPIHPGLAYPPLPVDLTHGAPAPRPRFRPAQAVSTPRFRRVG